MRKLVFAALAVLLSGFFLAASAQEQSIADAARKAREQKKNEPKAKRVFTNDNIPTVPGAVSTVGPPPQTTTDSAGGPATGGTETTADQSGDKTDKAKETGNDEATWRKKFAELRAKIAQAEKEADIMQRELNLKRQQYYSDPNVALKEQYSRGDINETKQKIDDKKKEIADLKQQLSDLEDDLRRAGGPAAWSRE